jgi:hypothetical protein
MTDTFIMIRRLRALAACVSLGLFSTGCSYATVGSGEVGVVWTPEGKPRALPEGQWGIGSGDVATLYNARSQEHGESLEVLAANGLRIVLDTSIRYHIVVPEAVALDHELGAHYYEVLLGPTLRRRGAWSGATSRRRFTPPSASRSSVRSARGWRPPSRGGTWSSRGC